jgi:hypothetical protein
MQAACGDVKAGEENRVIAKMHEITGGHRPSAGANVREDDADANQQADLSPGAAELMPNFRAITG